MSTIRRFRPTVVVVADLAFAVRATPGVQFRRK
jgi:hypothetical protein